MPIGFGAWVEVFDARFMVGVAVFVGVGVSVGISVDVAEGV